MGTQRLAAAAVLALAMGMRGDVAAGAEEPSSPIRIASQGNLTIDMAGADGRNLVAIEALPGGRIGFHVRVPGQDDFKMVVESLPGDRLRIIDHDDRTLDCARLTLNLRRDEPTRKGMNQEERLDELDEARARRDLLEMEVAVAKERLQKMSAVLWETKLQQIQGFSTGPNLSGDTPEQKKEITEQYSELLSQVQTEFLVKSRELSGVRRRVAELEAQFPLSAAAARPSSAEFGWRDVDRVLDLILRGMETWRQSSPPSRLSSPPPAPDEDSDSSKDAERILELIRKGMESWQRPDPPTPSPVPSPSPVEPEIKDAERILELILRGVESWQRR
jgi:hypothetical protein